MKRTFLTAAFFLCFSILHAQTISVEDYINTYKDLAIAEMKRVGIPASVTLAQGILETENGNSELVKISNNHFGIKCKSTWTGETVTHTDDAPNECFRKYSKAEDSYRDHSNYLRGEQRYASLFLLPPADYKGWAYGLKRAGYATNPRYPDILISNIEKYHLQQYDVLDTTGNAELASTASPEPLRMKPAASPENAATAGSTDITANTRANGLRGLRAFKGTSLLAIATHANIPLEKLLEFNDLATDGLLKEDCWIYLEKKSKEGNRDDYTSFRDESLYNISQDFGIQLKQLAAINGLAENAQIKKGTRIILRAGQGNEDSK